VDLNYKTAQMRLQDATLNIGVLAERYDPAWANHTVAQTFQASEPVDCETAIDNNEQQKSRDQEIDYAQCP